MAKITIFGLAGTGTSSVGKRLAEMLGYEFFSSGRVFRKKAEELGLSLNDFETLCSNDSRYDLEVDEEVEHFGKTHDNCIIESRLAWHFVPDSFKIKLVCDFEERIQRVAVRDSQSIEEAREKTMFREKLHEERWPQYYDFGEYAPDSIFDIIVDTTKEPVEAICERLKKAVLDHASSLTGKPTRI